ncbi:hypothetical protein AWZ03_014051 [Drosophila navojoa]|uniref:Uncharacterized protein n=1 Tax=Drosophila navojoa TaxID=7232 RepID=A0A484AVD2_DRONA|nr:hypothetical protein AWZ03_014051 [Drosophila navojoa]
MRPGHLNRGKEVGGQTSSPMMPTIMIIKMHDSSHQPNGRAPTNDELDSPSAAGKGVRIETLLALELRNKANVKLEQSWRPSPEQLISCVLAMSLPCPERVPAA